MCCFSGPVRHVGATKIFARDADDDGRQLLAYAMDVSLDVEVAMVLPLPVPPRPPEDAVRFIDLEGYATFFDDLARAFPPSYVGGARGGSPARAATLVVHDVGAFEASFVPTHADFERLDPRFRLPGAVWQRLPTYADWGFAVFRLKPEKKTQRVHPMAFSFPRREPRSLFFPTVHVHDETVHETARFDHALTCQATGVLGATLPWTRSTGALGGFVDTARANDLVDGASGGATEPLVGDLPNRDLWLREPTGVTLDDLRGRGACYAFEARAGAAYLFATPEPAWRKRKETSATRLGAICRALREGLKDIEDRHRADWQLARLTDALPPHFLNGDELWRGVSFDDDAAPATGYTGDGSVVFKPFTGRVEPQDVTLAFARLPDADRVREIRAELARMLDRAAGA